MLYPDHPRDWPYDVQRITVPGGWIYHSGPLSRPVLVSDPSLWALNENGSAATNLALLSALNQKVNTIMATVADVQAALAANETRETTIIGLLTTEAQTLKDTQAQLAAALANPGGADPAALQAVVDKMKADGDAMDAAIASITPPAAGATGATGDAGTGATGSTGVTGDPGVTAAAGDTGPTA